MRGQLATTLLLALVLTILGTGLTLLLHVGTIDRQVRSMMDIVVELRDDVPQAERSGVVAALTGDTRVVEGSIEFLPRDQAVALMGGDDVDVSLLQDNPFSDLITFNLHASYYTDETLLEITGMLEALDPVVTVSAQSAAAADISAWVRKLAWVILLVGLVISALAGMLLHTSASMRLAKDKKRIVTMQLVGARRDYIERPYLRAAVTQAVLSSFIALTLLGLLALTINLTLHPLVIWHKLAIVFICLLVISVTHGVITNRVIIKRYLGF